ncbi:X-ray radiation resistance-associated protein 1 isoform X1 [Suncus etruscus]|uniref:X-ray radiation resistance-associated protein 1 isoform X1 n=1 Tax=Suncus etruscus TaxID=109475 RepID=UPI002110225F|nr:X-ray radiation resistance-associated protein 1 isoform X1 [Suncus etruscus]
MAYSGIYKMDEGKPSMSNSFPAKNLVRPLEKGRGHWVVARKGNIKKKPKGVLEVPVEEQASQVSLEVLEKKVSPWKNQGEHSKYQILDRNLLLKHHCVLKPSDLCNVNAKEKDFKHFHSVIYINASENLLPLEAFHTFPSLKELELAFNGIKTIYVKYGDFRFLEFLDLSFNSLTGQAISDLGILPHLRVLLLTGNGLTSLPANLAVTEQEVSVTSTARKRYILRFPALETLMLDDNKLSSPNCFASLAGLRRLKKLSLEQNRISRIPYLQQVQIQSETEDWVEDRGSAHRESQSILHSKPWMDKAEDEQPDYTVLPMKKDVDRTEVVFTSYPGFSTSETGKVCSLPPIFEILPVKSLRARNQTLAPPFPELRCLSLAYNKISKEDAILPVALFPSLCELIFHNNPLVAHTRGLPPLLKSFLRERLGIHLVRKKVVKSKHHLMIPQKKSRKVKTQVPKVPKQQMLLQSQPSSKSPSKDLLRSSVSGQPEELCLTRSVSPKPEMPVEGVRLPHQTFVPLPPICSDSTLQSEETTPHQNSTSHLSPEYISEEDTKSTESFFLTQVSGLPSSVLQRVTSESISPKSSKEVKKTQKNVSSVSLPSKYRGYEELLTVKSDPSFSAPRGIQRSKQALQHMLKHPVVYRSNKPRLDPLQKQFVPKERRAQRVPVPPPRKTRAQLLDDLLIRMRDPRNITEAPLGAVLRRRTEQRQMNQKQFQEAKRLLKEFRARYQRLVHASLRSVFQNREPPQARHLLNEGRKFGHFLQVMDDFYPEAPAAHSKG